jgi:hypothetical protein
LHVDDDFVDVVSLSISVLEQSPRTIYFVVIVFEGTVGQLQPILSF